MFFRTDTSKEIRAVNAGSLCRHQGQSGFTLLELLIAMILTALIGTVLFSSYILIADNGVKGRELVHSREAPRIFWGIVDTDIAGLLLSRELPLPSITPITPSKKWVELVGAPEDGEDGKHLLTFATTASLDSDGEERIAGPYCVEYVARQGRNGTALIRRERMFCGVDGDFPWTEAVLLTGLEDIEVKLCSVEHGEFDVPEEREWYRVGAVLPDAVLISLEYEGREAESLLIPIYKRRGNVLK